MISASIVADAVDVVVDFVVIGFWGDVFAFGLFCAGLLPVAFLGAGFLPVFFLAAGVFLPADLAGVDFDDFGVFLLSAMAWTISPHMSPVGHGEQTTLMA